MSSSTFRSVLKDLRRSHDIASSQCAAAVHTIDDRVGSVPISSPAKEEPKISNLSSLDHESTCNMISDGIDLAEKEIHETDDDQSSLVMSLLTLEDTLDRSTYHRETDAAISGLLNVCQVVADRDVNKPEYFMHTLNVCCVLLRIEMNKLYETTAWKLYRSAGGMKAFSVCFLGLHLLKELIVAVTSRRKSNEQDVNNDINEANQTNLAYMVLKDFVIWKSTELLDHPEPRIRSLYSDILYLTALNERTDYYNYCNTESNTIKKCDVPVNSDSTNEKPLSRDAAFELYSLNFNYFTSIHNYPSFTNSNNEKNVQHFSLYHAIGPYLLQKISNSLHRTATTRPTNLGENALIALDDTTGLI